MANPVEQHVLYQIFNAPVRTYPYPHIYVENVFPEDFYRELRSNWPDGSAFVPLAATGRVPQGAYPERFVIPVSPEGIATLTPDRRPFWDGFGQWFAGHDFCMAMIEKFESEVMERLGNDIATCTYGADVLAVRDLTNYSIGPHTDAPHRLLSMLFYCPDDASLSHLGTSLYVPREAGFVCEGGPHYKHDRFDLVKTMEYKPNTLFAFVKNDHSFHGVEPIGDPEVLRDILLYDIRVYPPEKKPAATNAATQPGGLGMLKRLFNQPQ